MYAGESRAASSAANVPITSDAPQSQGDYPPTSETGPALELVEFANGETIWWVDIFGCGLWFHSDRVLGQLLMASGTMMENPFTQVAQVLRQNTPLVRPLPRVVFRYS